jgi:poly(3-hydroxybutyrate) depolymerase
MSNGGGFVGTLACDSVASNRFAAFGAGSGAFYQGASPDNCNPVNVTIHCNPGRLHIPFLEVHGTNDGQINYNGGGHNNECLPSIPYFMTAWGQREGYGTVNTTTALSNGNVEYSWGVLNGISPVVVQYQIQGMPHDWASGSNSGGFMASPTMVAFFNQWVLSTEL